MKLRHALCASAALSGLLATPAFAQDDVAEDEGSEIIVTAVARGQNRIESSVSVSTIGADTIANLAAPSAADLIRQIPGIRSEASGGEGNANIAVRGIPVSTGGARYIQLQEDGLPILEFGDIIFGNADNFLRADRSVARVEAVRGGSASTFASNAPGAVINFISKTGQLEGGAIQASVGLDFESYRLDFDYGAPLAEDLYFHVGGFYRTGEGPRDIGYNGFDGGQIKANITKEFDSGYIRFHAKYLDDRTPTILPQPVRVGGTGGNPDYQAIPGFDPRRDSLYSPFLNPAVTLDGNNNPASFDFREGLSVQSLAFGIESEFDVGGGWTVTNRFRFADNSGSFQSPFPAGVDAAQTVANNPFLIDDDNNPETPRVLPPGFGGARLSFASGPNAGQAITNPGTLGGNGLLAEVVVFNVRLNSLDNVTNDFRVNKQFDFGGGSANFTTGFYMSRQTINTDWLWTSHVQTVQGDGQAVLVDIADPNGNLVTQNGTIGFGASFFGNCCRRNYDVDYSTYAPFASLSLELDRLTIDASIRYDFGDASGTITGTDSGFGIGLTSFDFDNNGAISPAEAQTSVLPLGNARPVNYDFDYFSFSLGANYLVTDDLGVFARYSQGGRHTADRSLFSPAVSAVDGSLPGGDAGVIARVDQLEAGLKYQSGGLALYATGFYAETSETNVDIAPVVLFDTTFEAFGIELEGAYRTGPFTLSAGATWTDAEIKDALNPDTIGNTPRRQADLVYQATAQYDTRQFTLGANIVGTTESFTQDNNDLVLPAFAQVNAFLAFRPIERVELGLNATNLFNATGFTEAEEGSIPANGLVRARSIAGRTVLASVRFDF
ncbi:TonB-dependent receptor [Porphyrobacter sp. HT-58-2]|uniref:TonB-dependent receptor n=1 Tax=Porphyrobacter sp. HT-58-2 TaxID=2023229 RepID=UPI000CDBCF1B|nr:TonB-dependent receptor [Porphyrobacter sp. HT-58-2]AUX69201.1 TonB-dependent receptor [Porphyrobacter sp. HT-58-2]